MTRPTRTRIPKTNLSPVRFDLDRPFDVGLPRTGLRTLKLPPSKIVNTLPNISLRDFGIDGIQKISDKYAEVTRYLDSFQGGALFRPGAKGIDNLPFPEKQSLNALFDHVNLVCLDGSSNAQLRLE